MTISPILVTPPGFLLFYVTFALFISTHLFFCQARHTDNIETFDEIDNNPFQKFKYSTNLQPEWNEIESIEPFEDNSITPNEYRPMPIDLSGDIRVNQILADSGAPLNPDAEFIYDIREPQNVRQTDRFVNPR